MIVCRFCRMDIEDANEVVAEVQGVMFRETPVSHALDVRDELRLVHWVCYITEERKGKWERLWDALKNCFRD